ncbi:hypothetical protein SGLAD_v1c06060 [Spiroplasma gladiatoris]|uniref:Uncharacterized protein n=1 Tax=Spiroplasma gladiatoris TaxID=2143 RepID=A0A4P7AH92_9MOLU|nr:hypothetical protein SGLAD_v1c06060 [Spiroplasma gladiatoris]
MIINIINRYDITECILKTTIETHNNDFIKLLNIKDKRKFIRDISFKKSKYVDYFDKIGLYTNFLYEIRNLSTHNTQIIFLDGKIELNIRNYINELCLSIFYYLSILDDYFLL